MKVKSKIYAKALAELLSKKITVPEEKIIENFLKLLKKNGDEKKAKEIINLAKDLFFKKTGQKKIILETARQMSARQREITKIIMEEEGVIEEKINPELIAGVKIIINNERQLDVSMLKKLKNIF